MREAIHWPAVKEARSNRLAGKKGILEVWVDPAALVVSAELAAPAVLVVLVALVVPPAWVDPAALAAPAELGAPAVLVALAALVVPAVLVALAALVVSAVLVALAALAAVRV